MFSIFTFEIYHTPSSFGSGNKISAIKNKSKKTAKKVVRNKKMQFLSFNLARACIPECKILHEKFWMNFLQKTNFFYKKSFSPNIHVLQSYTIIASMLQYFTSLLKYP
jgi:hypothetical protein